jgi:hypothetical protein
MAAAPERSERRPSRFVSYVLASIVLRESFKIAVVADPRLLGSDARIVRAVEGVDTATARKWAPT